MATRKHQPFQEVFTYAPAKPANSKPLISWRKVYIIEQALGGWSISLAKTGQFVDFATTRSRAVRRVETLMDLHRHA